MEVIQLQQTPALEGEGESSITTAQGKFQDGDEDRSLEGRGSAGQVRHGDPVYPGDQVQEEIVYLARGDPKGHADHRALPSGLGLCLRKIQGKISPPRKV